MNSNEREDIKTMIKNMLMESGDLSTLKSNLRASVYSCVLGLKETPYQNEKNELIDEYNATEESAIEIALLVEFMKFFNLKNTLSVFEAEMKLNQPIPSRADLIERLAIREDSSKPLISCLFSSNPTLTSLLSTTNQGAAFTQTPIKTTSFSSFSSGSAMKGSTQFTDRMNTLRLSTPTTPDANKNRSRVSFNLNPSEDNNPSRGNLNLNSSSETPSKVSFNLNSPENNMNRFSMNSQDFSSSHSQSLFTSPVTTTSTTFKPVSQPPPTYSSFSPAPTTTPYTASTPQKSLPSKNSFIYNPSSSTSSHPTTLPSFTTKTPTFTSPPSSATPYEYKSTFNDPSTPLNKHSSEVQSSRFSFPDPRTLPSPFLQNVSPTNQFLKPFNY